MMFVGLLKVAALGNMPARRSVVALLRTRATVPALRVAALAISAFLIATLSAEQLPGATGAIAGVVVDGSRSIGLLKATVSLFVGNRRVAIVSTDREGRFSFAGLAPGMYSVTASSAGYAPSGFDAEEGLSSSRPIEVAAGQLTAGVTIRLWKFAVVTGVVRDQSGEPLPGLQVMALKSVARGGRTSLVPANRARTDDRGSYRLVDLEPSTYAIALRSSDARTGQVGVVHFPTLYFPGTPSISAANLLELGKATERGGVDFSVADYPVFSVSGTLGGRPANQPRQLIVKLWQKDAVGLSESDCQSAPVDAEGRFLFQQVVQGDYIAEVIDSPPVIESGGSREVFIFPAGASDPVRLAERMAVINRASSGASSSSGSPGPLPTFQSEPAHMWWAQTPVSVVDRDVQEVALALKEGASIGGKVVFEGTAAKPSGEILAATIVMPLAVSGRQIPLQVSGITSSADFRTAELPPGAYELAVIATFPGWTLAGVSQGGRQLPDGSVELGDQEISDLVLTYIDRPAVVQGLTIGTDGRPEIDATIYVFPSNKQAWRSVSAGSNKFQVVRPSASGSFRFVVPPGSYYVSAVKGSRRDWRLEDRLDALSKAATLLTLTKGQSLARNLNVSTVK